MASRKPKAKAAATKNQLAHLTWLVGIVTGVKLLVMVSIGDGAWLGADGENYISQVDSLRSGGLFVEGLNYWPAGYAITLWFLSLPWPSAMLWVISFIQTLVWSISIWLLARELLQSRIAWAALPFAYLAMLNPTLTLTSLTVGYETLAGAMQVLAVALLLRDFRLSEIREKWPMPVAGALLGYSVALQPRLILGAAVIIVVWLAVRRPWKQSVAIALLATLLLALFPLGLMGRNQIANGRPTISSNLGVNMMMGVGSDSTGTYGSESKEVDCGPLPADAIDADNAKVGCALRWYLDNPGPTLALAWKKSVNFWSPWWGPLAAGTMARNPYLNIHPIKTLTTTQEMLNLVVGPLGTLIAWLWVVGGWALLGIGAYALARSGLRERLLAAAALAVILGSWAVSLATFGDHRFRLPIMGLSLLLQVVGVGAALSRGKLMRNR